MSFAPLASLCTAFELYIALPWPPGLAFFPPSLPAPVGPSRFISCKAKGEKVARKGRNEEIGVGWSERSAWGGHAHARLRYARWHDAPPPFSLHCVSASACHRLRGFTTPLLLTWLEGREADSRFSPLFPAAPVGRRSRRPLSRGPGRLRPPSHDPIGFC